MPDAFNPYHKWLGIPLNEQPPHHYRLLGLALFESDLDVIEAAADRQMSHIQKYKTGPHSIISQELLNELAAAKLCLLIAEKKVAYDQRLKGELEAAARSAPASNPAKIRRAVPLEESPIPQAPTIVPLAAVERLPPAAAAPLKLNPVLLGGVALAVVAAVTVLMLALPGSQPTPIVNAAASRPNVPEPAPRQTLQLAPPGRHVVKELEQLSVRLKLQGDSPVDDTIAFALSPGAPAGVGLDSRTGQLTWQPTEEQGPGEYRLSVRLVDAATQKIWHEMQVALSVEEVDQPPQLEVVAGADDPSGMISLLLRGRDLDMPAKRLSYSLDSTAPSGASLDAQSGQFKWLPSAEHGGKQFDLNFRVTEEGAAGLATNTTYRISVKPQAPTPEPAKVATTNPPAPPRTPDAAAQAATPAEIKETIELEAASLKKAPPTKTLEEARALTDRYTRLIDEAAKAEMYDIAIALATSAVPVAQRTKDFQLYTGMQNRGKDLRATRKDYDAAQAALEVLKSSPDDAAANLAAGTYLCFGKQRWPEGLKLLCKSSNEKLTAAATRDLAALSNDDQWMAAGDAWWSAADAARGIEKDRYQQRAAHWYRGLLPRLAGLEKLALEKKLKEVPIIAPAGVAPPASAVAASSTPATVRPPTQPPRARNLIQIEAPDVPPGDPRQDRLVAEAILKAGVGRVQITLAGKLSNDISTLEKLPEGEIELTKVSATKSGLDGDHFVACLKGLKHLTTLGLSNTSNLTDAGFESLGHLQTLKEVNISTSEVTDAGMTHLSRLVNLETLVLTQARFSDVGLAAIVPLVGLKVVWLWSENLSDQAFRHLAAVPNLQRLGIQCKQMNGSGFAFFPQGAPLRDLTLHCDRLLDAHLLPLQNLTNLAKLYLDGNCSDAVLNPIGKLSGLEELTLDSTVATGKGLATLASCQNLKSLRLVCPRISDQMLAEVGQLKSLTSLTIGQAATLTGSGLVHLAGLPQLWHLDLQGAAGLTDASLVHLEKCLNLKRVHLAYKTQFSDAALANVAKVPQMEHLSIAGKGITDAGLSHLKSCSTLESLHLEGTQVTDQGVAALKQLLPKVSVNKSS